MSKTILLTGAAGFIGSNLLCHLFRKYPEDRFIVLDALTYAGNQKNIPAEIRDSGRFEFWHGDISNPYIVNELMSRAQYVVHLAAETHVARSIFDNTKFFQTDVIGTQTLVNALLNNASVERFIHISTSEVYGSSVREIMDEDHPLNPMSPYAGAKAGADRLVHSYWSYSDLPIVILRPFNNYGPGQHMEKMIPRFVTSAIKNEPLTVHGRGTAARDWLFVEDHCEAIDRVLHADDFSRIKNQVINIGTGRATSVLDVAKMVLRLLGRPDDLIGFIGDRPGQVQRHCSSTEKARAMLGWESKTALEEGLARTIEWYRTHEPWWREQEWMKCVPIRTAKGSIEMH